MDQPNWRPWLCVPCAKHVWPVGRASCNQQTGGLHRHVQPLAGGGMPPHRRLIRKLAGQWPAPAQCIGQARGLLKLLQVTKKRCPGTMHWVGQRPAPAQCPCTSSCSKNWQAGGLLRHKEHGTCQILLPTLITFSVHTRTRALMAHREKVLCLQASNQKL